MALNLTNLAYLSVPSVGPSSWVMSVSIDLHKAHWKIFFCEMKKQRKSSLSYNYFQFIGYIVVKKSTANDINHVASDLSCLSNNLHNLFDNHLFIS